MKTCNAMSYISVVSVNIYLNFVCFISLIKKLPDKVSYVINWHFKQLLQIQSMNLLCGCLMCVCLSCPFLVETKFSKWSYDNLPID